MLIIFIHFHKNHKAMNDYKELLKMYMSKVMDIEGVSFIEETSHTVKLTDEEIELLKEIEKEICNE